MKAIVTGGAGFVGSHIVDALIAEGIETCVVDSLWEKGGGRTENVNPLATFYKMDIGSPSLATVFERERPDIVYHEAAQHSVAISTDDPELDAQVNILGTMNVLRCCTKAGTKKIVFASTGATHGIIDTLPITEKTPQRPGCPYGITKMAAEYYLRYWYDRYGLKYTIFRYANIYGPRQDATGEAGVIAIFAKKIIAGEPVMIRWDGEQTRDFVYVGDVARANLMAATAGSGQVYCLGTGIGISINSIFRQISRYTGNQVAVIKAKKTPGDQRDSLFDSSKARRDLGWVPEIPLCEGIEKTVDFFRKDMEDAS